MSRAQFACVTLSGDLQRILCSGCECQLKEYNTFPSVYIFCMDGMLLSVGAMVRARARVRARVCVPVGMSL